MQKGGGGGGGSKRKRRYVLYVEIGSKERKEKGTTRQEVATKTAPQLSIAWLAIRVRELQSDGHFSAHVAADDVVLLRAVVG